MCFLPEPRAGTDSGAPGQGCGMCTGRSSHRSESGEKHGPMCFVCAVPSGAGPDGVSSARFTQACAIRDPNSGYVFDLNPLNSSEGYVVSGIGKTFLVRCL